VTAALSVCWSALLQFARDAANVEPDDAAKISHLQQQSSLGDQQQNQLAAAAF
jgi:hypothetical protein